MNRALLFGLLMLALASQAHSAPFEQRELLTNGDFEAGAQAPTGWQLRPGASWEKEGNNHFLHLQSAQPGATTGCQRVVPLEPGWGVLRLSCRVRFRDIVMGPEGWHDGRIAMTFQDAHGQGVGDWPNVLHWTGTSPEWKQESRDYVIPEGAASLTLELALFSVQSGQIDFDDVRLAAIRPRPQLEDAPMPAAASAVPWESATRSILSLNGFWRFRPLGLGDDAPALEPEMLTTPPPFPKSAGWGWIPVPSAWPGQGREGHSPVAPDIWELKVKWSEVEAAWYEREVTVPADWSGRHIWISFDMPQTQVALFVNGASTGVVRWPGGRLEITDRVRPGETARLTAFVTALPFSAEKMVAMRPDMVVQAKSEIRFRGLCGDVSLESEPAGARLGDVQLRPSVRHGILGVRVRVADTAPGARYTLAVDALWKGKPEASWRSTPAAPLADGSLEVAMPWLAHHLWDLDQPNLYTLRLRLRQTGGDQVLDEEQERLGFREVWLQGRDIYLNGTRVHWRALNFSNHQSSAGAASYSACRETFGRMRSLGFNFAILGNYGVDPGETMTFEDLLRAADDSGFLLSFSAPHPLRSLAGWDSKRGMSEEWKALADYCVRCAQNHPSVLAYAISHNSLGYNGDQDPAKMDGKVLPRPASEKAARDFLAKREVAAAAEAYLKAADPTRLVYHHESGNMGDWHTANIYLNWAPIQERMDWLSHWATEGVKPLFFVEYGLPHQASWGSHRLGPFIWTNKVSSEPWAVEFGAAITGDAAYQLTPAEEQHIDRYERVYQRGQPFHISEVLGDYWSEAREHNMVEIQSEFTRHVWPALRTWGISAVLPWDQGDMARPREGSDRQRLLTWKPEEIASPGIHPDFVPNTGDYFDCGNVAARELSSLGETFRRVNADFFAYIAGKPEHFTEQGHIYGPGERIVKQIIILNDRRMLARGNYAWSVSLANRQVARGAGAFSADPGCSQCIPIAAALPAKAAGEGQMTVTIKPETGMALQDTFAFTVLAPSAPIAGPVALFDPGGETAAALARLGVRIRKQAIGIADQPVGRVLVVGRKALTVDGPAPDIAPVLAKGGTVLVLEQEDAVLSKRLGFRTNTPSLRRAFVRVPDHPALAGISNDLLHDWRGSATLIPPHFDLPDWEDTYPMVDWLGFKNSRAWKWGSQGQVASVVIEKPQGGDFLSILDGGFDVQYSPLLEARVGSGRIVFCQMDVTGRTETDPAAQRLLANLVHYAMTSAAPAPPHPVRSLAGEAVRRLLTGLGVNPASGDAGSSDVVLADSQSDPAALRTAADSGARVVVLDGKPDLLKALVGTAATVQIHKMTHTPPPIAAGAAWRGIGPAELHFRGRTEVATVTPTDKSGTAISTGVLAEVRVGKGSVVCCGVSPLDFDYNAPNKPYLKLTYKRTAALVARILANAGADLQSPLANFWARPVETGAPPRWLSSYYLDTPTALDDPYRYNRW